jgi:exodeoxyribonuclease VII large subunit
MQGKRVEEDVAGALKYFNKISSSLDVIVITRGGGSKADLAWFDNKRIATSIANSKIAILSALGHQTDISVTDMVAHTSLKTPTKVAQFLVERITQSLTEIEDITRQILEGSLLYLDKQRQKIKTQALVIDSGVLSYFRDHHKDLTKIQANLANFSLHYLKDKSQSISQKTKRIQDYFKRALHNAQFNVKYIQSKLDLLNPRTILKRGYSITLKDKRTVKSTSQLKRGDSLTTVYSKGKSTSIVREIKKDE